MFVHFLLFFITYHLTGFFRSYQDFLNSDVKRSVNTVNKYIQGYKHVMFNTGFVSYFVFQASSNFITPTDSSFVRHVEIMKYMSCLFIMDFLRFFTHRLFHTPFLYERFHRVNHQFVISPSWLFACTHWIDWVCSYLFPCIIPIILIDVHQFTLLFWIFSITFVSMMTINDSRSLHYIFPDRFFSSGLLSDRLFGNSD